MKGLFIPDITAEMFRNGCLESIEALMAEGEIYDIEYSRWIPVSEGLPYIGQRVLVTTETLDNGKKVTGTYYDRYGFVCGNVLAWMPLPKPYEPQESEGT